MQCCQAVDVGSVDVGAFDEQPLDLILVGGCTGRQEDAAVGELDLLVLPLGLRRLLAGLTFLPSFQLFGAFEQRGSRSRFQGTHFERYCYGSEARNSDLTYNTTFESRKFQDANDISNSARVG